MSMNIKSLQILILILLSFDLHLVWESNHIVLYTGYEDIETRLPIPIWATIGDVLYTLFALLIILFIKKTRDITRLDKKDYIFLTILGFAIALFVEYKAMILKKWSYADLMPIIPILKVGLSPIIQMALILPLSFWITAKISRFFFAKENSSTK